MKKIYIIHLLLLFVCSLSFAGQISGEWIITKTIKNNNIKEPYFTFTFKEDGNMFFMGIPFGTWQKKSAQELILKSQGSKDFNGNVKILKLTNDELIIENSNFKAFFEKIDLKNKAGNNKNSGFIGNWKIKANAPQTKILELKAPDKFTYVINEGGMTDTFQGNWIYNPKKKNIIFISMSKGLKGKFNVKNISKDKFIIQNQHEKLEAFALNKKDTTDSMEKLNFTYEDLPEEISENENLPWKDFDLMLDTLKNYKVVKYKYGTLIPDTKALKYYEIISEINVDMKKRKIVFTNFKIENNKKEQYSQNYKDDLSERYNYFFPKQEPVPRRIVGSEKITVPAGNFECTVVEGMDGDTKVKYWMINDLPGIYAKIIKDGTDSFGNNFYVVQTLKELK
jgi:hypothetical protein